VKLKVEYFTAFTYPNFLLGIDIENTNYHKKSQKGIAHVKINLASKITEIFVCLHH
jgi:hypothetical protein